MGPAWVIGVWVLVWGRDEAKQAMPAPSAHSSVRTHACTYTHRTQTVMNIFPPIHRAAYNGNDAVVARLLALGADVTQRDAHLRTAAHWACMGNSASALTLLLDHGASLNALDRSRNTPLMIAAI